MKNSYAWHWNNDAVILDKEQAYITHDDDLMAICPHEKGYLCRLIGRFTLSCRYSIFRRTLDGKESYDPETQYLARLDRIDQLVAGILFSAGLVMLIVPLWIL